MRIMAHRKAACKNCGRVKWVAGRGLCGACYGRLRRNGTFERSHAVNKGKMCAADGCERRAFSKGFCELHYRQSRHPLRTTWRILRSREGEGGYPPSWDDFEAFIADVGERPSTKHQLRRLDPAKSYSHENVHWQAPVYAGNNTPDYHRPYSKAWNLKKNYGLTVEEYEQRIVDQDGVCAVCKMSETAQNHHTGALRSLIVDHCHETEANGSVKDSIRGLLCNRCNRTLGLVKDDADLLRNLAAYLDHHRQLKSA